MISQALSVFLPILHLPNGGEPLPILGDRGHEKLVAFLKTIVSELGRQIISTHWLIETCTNSEISDEEREQHLIAWKKVPFARFCHPREEYLLPLHVCYGSVALAPALQ